MKYLLSISLTVSGLKGAHVPLDRAACSSWADMEPLLSVSTLIKTKSKDNYCARADKKACYIS